MKRFKCYVSLNLGETYYIDAESKEQASERAQVNFITEYDSIEVSEFIEPRDIVCEEVNRNKYIIHVKGYISKSKKEGPKDVDIEYLDFESPDLDLCKNLAKKWGFLEIEDIHVRPK